MIPLILSLHNTQAIIRVVSDSPVFSMTVGRQTKKNMKRKVIRWKLTKNRFDKDNEIKTNYILPSVHCGLFSY